MTMDQVLSLSDHQAVLTAFVKTEPVDKVSAAELKRYKDGYPESYAELAEDCRAHLLTAE